jgi:ribosomal protein S18 acetylase RimI-like enzyme
VVQRSAGLPGAALDAIADLEKRVLASDGGRLKLEWGTLRSRPGDQVNDVVWEDDGRLLGFAGIYLFGGSVPEVTGMVDPVARRRGIATALLTEVGAICRERGIARVLLLVPRPSTGGHELAARFGGTLDHSEHAMVLDGDPLDGPTDARITMRTATPDDAAAVGAILAAAFDWTPDDLPGMLARQTEREQTLLIEQEGRPVGTVRITHDDAVGDDRTVDRGGIYGFAVHPDHQGRGIGRDVLRRCCRLLREQGAMRVGLEVAVENEHALGLYTSTGFRPVTTEDYYALRFG